MFVKLAIGSRVPKCDTPVILEILYTLRVVRVGDEIMSSKDIQHNLRYGERPAVFATMALAVAERLISTVST
jgi:hypothetical protein